MAGPFGAERDDHQEQNSAYSPTPFSLRFTVPIAQLAERLSVEQEVAGSCPARHPNNSSRTIGPGGWLRTVPLFVVPDARDMVRATVDVPDLTTAAFLA